MSDAWWHQVKKIEYKNDTEYIKYFLSFSGRGTFSSVAIMGEMFFEEKVDAIKDFKNTLGLNHIRQNKTFVYGPHYGRLSIRFNLLLVAIFTLALNWNLSKKY